MLRFLSLAVAARPTFGIETDTALLDGRAVARDVLHAGVETLKDVLDGGLCDDAAVAELSDALAGEPRPEWALTGPILVLPPVSTSAKVICIGRNYPAHADEREKPLPAAPVFWQKPGSAILAHEQPIVIPAWVEGDIDHEAELGVVIGTRAKDVRPEHALEHVAGYTVVNDVTARKIQDDDIANGWPWFRGKGLDTFCPIGPGIVPRAHVPDAQALRVTCRVNDEVRQDAPTAEMGFGVAALIAAVTRYITLVPGDVISTGTPGGVGPFVAGDTVTCEVSGVGVLSNPVERR